MKTIAAILSAIALMGAIYILDAVYSPAHAAPGVQICDGATPPNCAPVDAVNGVKVQAAIVGGGDASAANQTAVQANAGSDASKATAVQGVTGGKAIPVSAASLPLPAGASTSALQTSVGSTAHADAVAQLAGTQPVSAASLPLPAGAATAAKQPALGTAASPSADVITGQGATANNTSQAGNPAYVGATAVSAEPTLAANGQNAGLITDLAHKLITAPYANPENLVSGTTAAMTGTTSTSLVGAPGAGLRNYITNLTCVNSHATVGTFITIQDGSGGTALYTIAAAAVFGGATITLPAPLRQPTANTALFVADVTTGANVICSASGYKGQ